MIKIYTITQAAKAIGLPRRTLYRYIEAGLIPVEALTESRSVMLPEQVMQVKDVLAHHGRKGIRESYAMAA